MENDAKSNGIRDERFVQARQCAAYRQGMYALAAEAFTTEPDVQRLEELVAAAQAVEPGQEVRESEAELMSHLRGYAAEDWKALRTRVATEYAELFVGPRAPLAPLYESVYVGMPRRLNTEVTMAVRRFYERNGFVAVRRDSVPNDHVGLECEFMARLAASELDRWAAGDEGAARELQRVELEFVAVHLSAWLDDFAARVSCAWCADYYDAWARFLQAFVQEDDAYLSAELGL